MIKKSELLIVIVCLMLVSCGPKTRTIVPLSETDKSRIQKMAIYVQADEELKVSISKLKDRYYGAGLSSHCQGLDCIFTLIIDVVWMAAEESTRSHIDSKHSEEYNEDISEVEMDRLLSKSIDEYLDTAQAGFEAEVLTYKSTSYLSDQGYDTLLDITVDKLEVKLCPNAFIAGVSYPNNEGEGPVSSDVLEVEHIIGKWNQIHTENYQKAYVIHKENLGKVEKPPSASLGTGNASTISGYEQRINVRVEYEKLNQKDTRLNELKPYIEKFRGGDSVRFWIKFKGQLIRTRDDVVIWDREELYYDPKCEYVEEMQNDPKIIVDMLTRAIGDIAVNTVNEIQ